MAMPPAVRLSSVRETTSWGPGRLSGAGDAVDGEGRRRRVRPRVRRDEANAGDRGAGGDGAVPGRVADAYVTARLGPWAGVPGRLGYPLVARPPEGEGPAVPGGTEVVQRHLGDETRRPLRDDPVVDPAGAGRVGGRRDRGGEPGRDERSDRDHCDATRLGGPTSETDVHACISSRRRISSATCIPRATRRLGLVRRISISDSMQHRPTQSWREPGRPEFSRTPERHGRAGAQILCAVDTASGAGKAHRAGNKAPCPM